MTYIYAIGPKELKGLIVLFITSQYIYSCSTLLQASFLCHIGITIITFLFHQQHIHSHAVL